MTGDPKLRAFARHLLYNNAFPKRPPLAYGNGMVAGTWMIGACYKNPSRNPDGTPFYGAYPHGYLERVHAMFPDAKSILHVFSGGLTFDAAVAARFWQGPPSEEMGPTGYRITLVDMHGPEQGRYPTWQGDVLAMPEAWQGRFDLILADPPYSKEDAAKYDCPPPQRGQVMRALRRVCKRGGNLVWLDQVWPMHRKVDWKTWGTVGLVRSTNHRVRMVSMFEAV
jgi:hypothetical protein